MSNILSVLRTALEDRTLNDELPGYRAYAQRTGYRLLAGLWYPIGRAGRSSITPAKQSKARAYSAFWRR